MIGNEKLRMVHWLLISAALYVGAITLARLEMLPQVQIVCWKLGHINLAAFVGYRLDISIFRMRINRTSPPLEQIRRAIIIGAAMLAVSLGM